MSIEHMAEILKWGSVLFGFAAAALWFGSAKVLSRQGTEGVFLVTSDPNKKQDLEPWVVALRNQAHWNAAGAV